MDGFDLYESIIEKLLFAIKKQPFDLRRRPDEPILGSSERRASGAATCSTRFARLALRKAIFKEPLARRSYRLAR